MADLAPYVDVGKLSKKDLEELSSYLEKDPQTNFEKTFVPPPFVPDFSSIIVVDNLPIVGQEKRDKLIGVIHKLYVQMGSYLKESDIFMPSDTNGSSMGFCFVKYNNPTDAQNALTKTQGFALSKSNTFKVSLYSDLDKYRDVPEIDDNVVNTTFVEPMELNAWLGDAHGRDQFVLRHGKETELYWANTSSGEEPTKIYGGEREKEGGKVSISNN